MSARRSTVIIVLRYLRFRGAKVQSSYELYIRNKRRDSNLSLFFYIESKNLTKSHRFQ